MSQQWLSMGRFVRGVAGSLALLGMGLATLAAADEAKVSVPLKKVVLFNSGVGFFEHAADVEGDARVDLKFNVDDINDLLKSMVLQDLGGGRISTVSYGSKDPITKTLKTFAIDLTSEPTLADLLSQIRGEKVEIHAPNPIVGTILGVETRKIPSGPDKEPVATSYLNLLTDEGLRSVSLDNVTRIKLINEKLDAELRQALTILAMGHAADKKTVTLNFVGKGKRPVRVGYIQEAPIWKTSYRLVLKDGENPFLQGWAIVENTTEEDWNGVDLTLISGRPISFVMDLYQPLYVQRPVVEPELFASLRPQTYGQDLAEKQLAFQRKAAEPAAPPAPAAEALRDSLARRGLGANANRAEMAKAAAGIELEQRGVQSVAQAQDVGELFQYQIDEAVKLPRQQSAMLPIVNGSVQGEKVSIYNPRVQAKHPLNGLKLTNSTGLHLMQGPITVFDDGTYAGDAQIQDLPPGTERLISYALDLDVEVAPELKSSPDQLVSVRLVKGVMYISHKHLRAQHYVVKNSGKRAKKMLIEYPVDAAWTLVEPAKPTEKTRDMYRFALSAEPGKPAALDVREERQVNQQVLLTNVDTNTVAIYLNSKVVSDAVKQALAEVIRRKQALSDLGSQRKQLEQQVTIIDQEQNRIRQNMAQLDKNTDLYNRYVKKFGEQEDQVEKLREQIARLIQEEAKQKKSLDEFLAGMDLS